MALRKKTEDTAIQSISLWTQIDSILNMSFGKKKEGNRKAQPTDLP